MITIPIWAFVLLILLAIPMAIFLILALICIVVVAISDKIEERALKNDKRE